MATVRPSDTDSDSMNCNSSLRTWASNCARQDIGEGRGGREEEEEYEEAEEENI
jgi:hypothetical protein